ncbi:hypothetical protein ACH9L7_07770 [Haloferax sp. S1W]|uniref:hypothetical protein n=1 Tax=Haloferax sp. S1W TaxID=3377110 RepID=UPI0037C7454F
MSGEETDEYGQDLTSLKEEYESAKDRFQEQRETFKEFSHEGLKVFRLSVLLVGVPTAIFGAINPQSIGGLLDSVYSTECAVQSFSLCIADMGAMTNLTIPAFLLAVLFHIMGSGYESRGVHNETNPHDIHKIRNSNPETKDFYRAKLRAYEVRIEENDRIISAIEFILGFGKFMFGTAVSGVAAIAYTLVFNRPFEGLWVILALLVLFVSSSTFPRSYIQADGGIPWTFTPLYLSRDQRDRAFDRPDEE